MREGAVRSQYSQSTSTFLLPVTIAGEEHRVEIAYSASGQGGDLVIEGWGLNSFDNHQFTPEEAAELKRIGLRSGWLDNWEIVQEALDQEEGEWA